jgi:hypothetical protein
MSITIDHQNMVAAGGFLSATRQQNGGMWKVCWLKIGVFDRNQTITALLLADHVLSATGPGESIVGIQGVMLGHGCDGRCPMWPFIVTWADELGLTGQDATEYVEEYIRSVARVAK